MSLKLIAMEVVEEEGDEEEVGEMAEIWGARKEKWSVSLPFKLV